MGDTAYGAMVQRAVTAMAPHTAVVAPAPPANNRAGHFPKGVFTLDLAAETLTCRQGETVAYGALRPRRRDEGRVVLRVAAICAACPLGAQCVEEAAPRKPDPGTRSVAVRPDEAALQARRTRQAPQPGRRTTARGVTWNMSKPSRVRMGAGRVASGGCARPWGKHISWRRCTTFWSWRGRRSCHRRPSAQGGRMPNAQNRVPQGRACAPCGGHNGPEGVISVIDPFPRHAPTISAPKNHTIPREGETGNSRHRSWAFSAYDLHHIGHGVTANAGLMGHYWFSVQTPGYTLSHTGLEQNLADLLLGGCGQHRLPRPGARSVRVPQCGSPAVLTSAPSASSRG